MRRDRVWRNKYLSVKCLVEQDMSTSELYKSQPIVSFFAPTNWMLRLRKRDIQAGLNETKVNAKLSRPQLSGNV